MTHLARGSSTGAMTEMSLLSAVVIAEADFISVFCCPGTVRRDRLVMVAAEVGGPR
jgi:hypothetical protein